MAEIDTPPIEESPVLERGLPTEMDGEKLRGEASADRSPDRVRGSCDVEDGNRFPPPVSHEPRTLSGGRSGAVEGIDIRDITVEGKKLPLEVRRFLDPADVRLEMKIRFSPHVHRPFLLNWLIMGIDDQYDVKCLVPLEESVQYVAITHGGTSRVHGSCLSIYDCLQLLPIDQRLELDSRFTVSIPTVETPYARTVLSDSLIPVGRKGSSGHAMQSASTSGKGQFIPFNRRTLLLFLEPGETLAFQARVGYAPNFSLRERTHWCLLFDRPTEKHQMQVPPSDAVGLKIGTQLGRHPIAYLQTIVRQLNERLEQTVNNRFDYMLGRYGHERDRVQVKSYITAVSNEILSLPLR